MTPGEREVWRAVFAAGWFQSIARSGPGVVTDAERAVYAAGQAARAVIALRGLESDAAAEVLR